MSIFFTSLVDLASYVTKYQWDMAKYPLKQSLRNLAEIIGKQVGQIDTDLKVKSQAYNNLKGSLQSLEKKQTWVHFVNLDSRIRGMIIFYKKLQWELAYKKFGRYRQEGTFHPGFRVSDYPCRRDSKVNCRYENLQIVYMILS